MKKKEILHREKTLWFIQMSSMTIPFVLIPKVIQFPGLIYLDIPPFFDQVASGGSSFVLSYRHLCFFIYFFESY